LRVGEKTCEHCGGTGWVMIKRENREVAQRCNCQADDIYLTRGENANIPKRFMGFELKTFYPHKEFPSQKKVLKKVQKFIDDYPSVAEKGILFQGRAGVGKTRLLCAVATELMKKIESLDIYYIDWNDLVREMRTGEHHMTRNFSEINRFIEHLTTVELLLFDELGASNISDLSQWIMDSIYYIFNKRYNNQRVTLCAANFFDNPKDGKESLKDRIGERIRSRLYEMTETIVIQGSDRRLEM
jgi:DNA replication protein DnaC